MTRRKHRFLRVSGAVNINLFQLSVLSITPDVFKGYRNGALTRNGLHLYDYLNSYLQFLDV